MSYPLAQVVGFFAKILPILTLHKTELAKKIFNLKIKKIVKGG